jgi:hypothetical protein
MKFSAEDFISYLFQGILTKFLNVLNKICTTLLNYAKDQDISQKLRILAKNKKFSFKKLAVKIYKFLSKITKFAQVNFMSKCP